MHVIRLRGPWKRSLVDGVGEPPTEYESRTIPFSAPDRFAEGLPADYHGRIRLERVFHQPTGLTGDSIVRLSVEVDLPGQAALNGQPLGSLSRGENRFDVSARLLPQNRICLDLVIDAQRSMGQPICAVQLEIFPSRP